MNQRKNAIINAAQKLFIEKGYHTTSIQDIIDQAGISKGTFYNYFASKIDCLLAILESVHRIGEQKRLEIAMGRDKQDEEIFIQQIVVRSNMNREHDMLILFDIITHLDDPKIKEFLDKQYEFEIQWISNRLCEIYSPEVREYSVDYAVMLLGSIHHYVHVWKLATGEEVELDKVIRFILRRMKPMLVEQMKSQEKFFSLEWFGMEPDTVNPTQIRASIVVRIDNLLEKADKEQIEYLYFLKEELLSEKPRRFLIESIVLSLNNIFENSKMAPDLRKMVQLIEKYWYIQEEMNR